MAGIVIEAEVPHRAEVLELYGAVGWVAYTRSPDTLMAGLDSSLRVVTARVDGALVGLARVVGDGHTIVYLQDILVAPATQRQGIGRDLVRAAFAPYEAVRQHVLLTDDDPAQRAFYESLGFQETRDFAAGTLRAFVRFS